MQDKLLRLLGMGNIENTLGRELLREKALSEFWQKFFMSVFGTFCSGHLANVRFEIFNRDRAPQLCFLDFSTPIMGASSESDLTLGVTLKSYRRKTEKIAIFSKNFFLLCQQIFNLSVINGKKSYFFYFDGISSAFEFSKKY